MNFDQVPGVAQGPLHDLSDAVLHDPDRLLLRWRTGSLSTKAFERAARVAATHLRDRGIGAGDMVALMAGNSQYTLIATYGIWMLGAVEVAVNAELRGPMLRHVLDDSDPILIICDDTYESLIADQRPDLVRLALHTIADHAEPIEEVAVPAANDLASLLYTSGTTGPSKGVMIPHGYYTYFATKLGEVLELSSEDTCYFTLPFFHIDAHIALPANLRYGSVLAFAPRFSVSSFWTDVECFGATWFGAVGSMLSALITQGHPSQNVLDKLRLIIAAPIPAEAFDFFEDELGIPLLQMYGQTEANGPLYSTLEFRRRGAMGMACAGFDIRVVNSDGSDVPIGSVGEMLTRPQSDAVMSLGYWRRPDATEAAFQGGWFHTGDLVRRDQDGFFWYAGRKTDSLRKRGENVSAYELEAVMREAPGVVECAAIAVRDELGGEDDIKAVLVVDRSFEQTAFIDYCRVVLPRFAVPRYLEIVSADQVIRGPGTGAIQKHLLPQGIQQSTVDLDLLRSTSVMHTNQSN